MKLWKLLSNSISATAVLSILGVGGALMLIGPLHHFVAEQSTSVIANFYCIGGFLAFLTLVSLALLLLISRLIWGDRRTGMSRSDDDGDDVLDSMRQMKGTGTKRAFIFVALLMINVAIFDAIGKGVLVSDNHANHVLTQLRSKDGQTRADAMTGAIQLVGDRRVALALQKIIEQPGAAREWAAYAAGIRRDEITRDSLVELLKKGRDRERAAAATALARMEDKRLVGLILGIYDRVKPTYQSDLVLALAMVGKRRVAKEQTLFTADDLARVGAFFVEKLTTEKPDKVMTRLYIYALNRFESPEGLPYLEGLLSPQTDTETLCLVLSALGNIGAADSSPKIVALIPKLDKTAACKELVATDFTGGQTVLARNVNLVAHCIYEIAHIGDTRAIVPMARLADNPAYSSRIRSLAREFVKKMTYR